MKVTIHFFIIITICLILIFNIDNAFASYTYETSPCRIFLVAPYPDTNPSNPTSAWRDYTQISHERQNISNMWIDPDDGDFHFTSSGYESANPHILNTIAPWTGTTLAHIEFWDGLNWVSTGGGITQTVSGWASNFLPSFIADISYEFSAHNIQIVRDGLDPYPSDPESGCGYSCVTAYNDLVTACGSESNIAFFNDEACEGYCLPCSDLAADCQSNCNNDVASFSCDSTIGDTATGLYTNVPLSLDLAPCICGGDQNCDQLAQICADSCGGIDNVESFGCADGIVTTPCICGNNPPPTIPPEEWAEGTPDEDDPNAETPPADPADPQDTTENMAHNLYEIAGNTHSISKNAKTIADNTAKIGQVLDQGLADINANLENLETKLDELKGNESDYNPGAIGEDYTTDPFDFSERLTTFIDDLKQTPLFSLPSQILVDIPTSSNSTISFDGGIYGQHTYDFASMGSVYVTLRAILITLFAYLSVRIVILKR